MSVSESKLNQKKKKKIAKQSQQTMAAPEPKLKEQKKKKITKQAAKTSASSATDVQTPTGKMTKDAPGQKKGKRKFVDTEGKGPPKKKSKQGSSEVRRTSKISHQDGAPDWRQIRADAAEVKERRKSHNKMFEVGKHMKKLWEELRVDKCAADRRSALIKELSGLVSGRVQVLVRAHDRARVCETMFQLGGEPARAVLFAEVKDSLAELSRDKYARHFVLKVLSYGSAEQKTAVGEAMRGRVPALAGHRFGGEVVEAYFRDAASPDAQQRMLMEFYGSEFFLATEATRTLEQLVAERPERRTLLLTNLRSQLQSLLDKQLVSGSLVHRLLREYLSMCAESDRAEVISSLREAVVQMLHTRDGVRVGLLCLWWGTTKDRKAIVKSLKTHVLKVCVDEHGFLLMLAVLDTVDDTRLVKKALLEELLTQVAEVVASEPGRKVVHYLLSPRDTTYFHPTLVSELSKGDDNPTSKKEPELRRRELLEAVSEPLLRTASIHCLEWLQDSTMCILLTHILTKCTGESLRLVLTQLARRTAQPVTSSSDNHLVNNTAAYMQLKKLVQADRQRAAAAAGEDVTVLFSVLVLRELSEEALLSWISANRTAFLLVLMLETEATAVVQAVLDTLQPHSRKLKPSCKGAEILKKKLIAARKEAEAAENGDAANVEGS